MTTTASSTTAQRNTLAQKLRALRQTAGCTQAEIADALAIKKGYVAHIESAYPRLDIERVEALVKKAHEYFSVPFAPPAAVTPVAPPAEVDNSVTATPAAVPLGISREAVAGRIRQFQEEFNVSIPELAHMFRLSEGHTYVIRTARPGASHQTLRNIVAILDRETAARRSRRTGARRNGVTPPEPVAAPIVSAATVTTGTDTVIPAILVRDATTLLTAIDYDFQTQHRFQKLPDGSYLIVKAR